VVLHTWGRSCVQPLTVEQAEHDGLEDVALLGRDLAEVGPKSAACIGYCNNNNSSNSNNIDNSVWCGVQLAGRTCSASPRPSTCRAMPVSGFRESPCGAIAFRERVRSRKCECSSPLGRPQGAGPAARVGSNLRRGSVPRATAAR
jgi:hypothetical protein